MLGGFIVILVGVNLIPTIAGQIWVANHDSIASGGQNLSTSDPTAATILDLVTIFFALGVMAAGVSLAVGGLRNVGLV